MALFARNYIKVPPSQVAIFYGRKQTLVDEKGNRATVGFRVVRGGARAARPGARAGRVPVPQRHLDPLKIQPACTKEGVPVTVEAVANVKIAGDDMSLRWPPSVSRHDGRTDQGRHLPDARRAPPGDSRHADGGGDQRRSPGLRAEDDRRGRRRSQEDGCQHRHPDDPADQRRGGLPRRAREEADGRGQARCGRRRGAGGARRDDSVGQRRPGRQDEAVRGRRDDRAVAARQGDETGRVQRHGAGQAGRGPQAGPLATAIARQKVTEQETRIDQVRKAQEVLVQEQEALRKEKELQATVVKPAEAGRQAAILRPRARNRRRSSRPRRPRKSSKFEGAGEAAKSGRSAAPRPRRSWPSARPRPRSSRRNFGRGGRASEEVRGVEEFQRGCRAQHARRAMPELAQAFATQLAGIDKINTIDVGQGRGRRGRHRQGHGHRGRRHDRHARDAEGSVRDRCPTSRAGQDRRRRGRAPHRSRRLVNGQIAPRQGGPSVWRRRSRWVGTWYDPTHADNH